MLFACDQAAAGPAARRASIAAVNPRTIDLHPASPHGFAAGWALAATLAFAGGFKPARRQARRRERDLRGRGGFRGRERVGGDRRLELPVRELHLVAQMLRVVAIDRAQHARQLVVGADPDLHQHVLVDERHHVGRDAADHLRLADVERDLEPVGDALVRIRHDDVGEREVDRRGVERRLQRGVDRRRRRGDGDQVLRRRERHHRLAVVVELGRRAVARGDHAQLVGPLHDDIGGRRVGERRAEAARALVGDDRGEATSPWPPRAWRSWPSGCRSPSARVPGAPASPPPWPRAWRLSRPCGVGVPVARRQPVASARPAASSIARPSASIPIITSPVVESCRCCLDRSGHHPAFEHLVDDRAGDLVDERRCGPAGRSSGNSRPAAPPATSARSSAATAARRSRSGIW